MICLCIGICQLQSVSEILNISEIFKSKYTKVVYYQVFNITEDKMKHILENEVKNADLILSQPVSEKYKGTDIFSTKKLRETALKYGKKHYIISNCYFTGYDPNPFQTTNEYGEILHFNNISYIPSMCFDELLDKNIEKSCIKWCNIDYYNKSQLEKNINNTLNELKSRESDVFGNGYGIDIKISDFIEENYKKVKLFHTYNHPTNVLLIELSRRVMNRIG